MISPVVVMRSAMCSRSASASGGAADRPAVGPEPHRTFTVLARAHFQGATGAYPVRPESGTKTWGPPALRARLLPVALTLLLQPVEESTHSHSQGPE